MQQSPFAQSLDSFSPSSLVRLLPYLVLLLLGAQFIYYLITTFLEYRADLAFGARHGCQPPPQLPNRWPLGVDRLKELWDSNRDGRLLAFLCSVAVDYEPRNNLSQFMLIGPRVFHTLHPKNVEAVLSTNFIDYGFGVRRGVFAPLLGNGIFTQEGHSWKHSRELLRKQFARTQYQNLDHFQEHVDNLITRLPSNGVVDLQPLFFSLTMDVATDLLFGRSVYSLKADEAYDQENRLFAESFNIAQEGLAKRFRIAPWHFLYNPPEFRRACSIVHRFVEGYIQERNQLRENNVKTEHLYGFLNQVEEESVTNEDLRDQLLNVLLAGRDTAACCLSWTFRLLVRHPKTLERLRSEVRSVMGDGKHASRENVRKMPYLANIIKESLRLYPPVPLNNRTALKTTILPTGGGPDGNSPILVRRGEVVIFSQYVNSRKKNLYGEDAYEFRPERWETGELASIGWAFFPFNGGPRICLGQDFALMEVSYAIIRLLQETSDIFLPLGEKVGKTGTERQKLTLVLSSADGCRVHVRR